MRKMPEILVFGVVGLAVDLQRHIMCLGIVDLLFAGFDVPLTPGSNDRHIRSKVADSQLKADLVVAFTGTAMNNSVRPLLLRNLNQSFSDYGTGVRGTEQIIFIYSSGLKTRHNVLVDVFVSQIEHIEFGSAGFEGFLLQPLQLIALANITGDSYDLAVVVILLKPGDNDGCVEAA